MSYTTSKFGHQKTQLRLDGIEVWEYLRDAATLMRAKPDMKPEQVASAIFFVLLNENGEEAHMTPRQWAHYVRVP